jgi:arabinan endo-1,5-alpha-L-arabinosidase
MRKLTLTATLLILASTSCATSPARVPAESPPFGSFRNPVLFQAETFADPGIVRDAKGVWYSFATQSKKPGAIRNIQVARSQDLVKWELASGDALPVKPTWASDTQDFWAPDVQKRGDRYLMYYSGERTGHKGFCIGVAVAKDAAGPYKDSGQPLYCHESFRAIDPMAYDDPVSGRSFLFWGSMLKPLLMRELDASGLKFREDSPEIEVIKDAGTEKSGREYENLIEASWITLRDGYYYYFYSGDNCCNLPNPHYAVLVARMKAGPKGIAALLEAKDPTALWEKHGPPILKGDAEWLGPGHNSVLTDDADQDWMLFHAAHVSQPTVVMQPGTAGEVKRVLLIDRIRYENGWPVMNDGTPRTLVPEKPVLRAR